MKRNYSIELLKLYFAICIAFGHANRLREGFGTSIPSISSGMIVVLFYILSGFFLVKSFDSGKYSDPWNYSLARLKRIYPYYIVAFLLLFTYENLQLLYHVKDFIRALFMSLPEIFLVQNVGVFPGGINYPLWQMCCLVVASHVLFGLLMWNRQATLNVICPVFAICTFTALANAYGGDRIDMWQVLGEFFYGQLIRATGSLALGMLAYTPINLILKALENVQYKFMPILISLSSIVAFLVLWINRGSYAIVFPFFAILICMLYSKGVYAKYFQIPFLAKLDKLSLAIYLTHALTIKFFSKNSYIYENLSDLKGDMLYIVVVILVSIALIILVDFMSYLISKAKPLLTKLKTE